MLSFKRSYELPLGRNYVRHWGMQEAVREILQNALDSESPFEYEIDDDTLKVHSKYTVLSPSTLLLGQTSKSESVDMIGSFGEGYKIALLVLARNGYKVRMLNGDRIWEPSFKMSRQFEAEVLHIEDSTADTANQGLTFEVSGLSPGDIALIKDSCLHMQSTVGKYINTQYGRILRDRPGKLYVGGLLVCETGLTFGYDVLPKYLRLERDRQTVGGWDLKQRTKEMWLDTDRYDEIAHLLSIECPDLDHIEYGAPQMVKEACYAHFRKKHPHAIAATSQEELEELIKEGMTEVVYTGGGYGASIRGAGTYPTMNKPVVLTPQMELEEWFEAYGEILTGDAKMRYERLMSKAGGWRLS